MRRIATLLTLTALLCGAFTTSAAAAPRRRVIRHSGGVEGRFIVVKKNGKPFVAAMSSSRAQRLANERDVLLVEQDVPLHALGVQVSAPWGLDRIDQRARPLDGQYSFASSGAGVHAYIIDTGILPQHEDFGGRASVAYDAVGDGRNGVDCNGHGTHVAGTIGGTSSGVAKDVTLHGVRVLGCTGSGYLSWVIAGLNWVAANHQSPAVANMSLGGGISPSLDDAVANAVSSGVTVVVAAGNSGADACATSPARAPSAITVAATASDDSKASWSNYGTCVDLGAPGVGVRSAWYSATNAYASLSGTSMAAPHVAGVAALMLGDSPAATPSQVADAIIGSATPDLIVNAGVGTPNRLLYAAAAPVEGNIAPSASFSTSCAQTACQFTDASSDPDGSIASWAWSFGDGRTSTEQNPSVVYATTGTYSVQVTVTDDEGATATMSKSVTVTSMTLTGTGWYMRRKRVVTLSWSGVPGKYVSIMLDGRAVKSLRNRGPVRLMGVPAGTHSWRICARGTTSCTNAVTITLL